MSSLLPSMSRTLTSGGRLSGVHWWPVLGVHRGVNGNAHFLTRGAYGFRSFQFIKTLPFHRPGKLPKPPLTHSFA